MYENNEMQSVFSSIQSSSNTTEQVEYIQKLAGYAYKRLDFLLFSDDDTIASNIIRQ